MYPSLFLPFPRPQGSEANDPAHQSGILAVQHTDDDNQRISLHWLKTNRDPEDGSISYTLYDYNGGFMDTELSINTYKDPEPGRQIVQAVSDPAGESDHIIGEGTLGEDGTVTWDQLDKDHIFTPRIEAILACPTAPWQPTAGQTPAPAGTGQTLAEGQTITWDIPRILEAHLTVTPENFEPTFPHSFTAAYAGDDLPGQDPGQLSIFHLYCLDPITSHRIDESGACSTRFIGYLAKARSDQDFASGRLAFSADGSIRYAESPRDLGFPELTYTEQNLPQPYAALAATLPAPEDWEKLLIP